MRARSIDCCALEQTGSQQSSEFGGEVIRTGLWLRLSKRLESVQAPQADRRRSRRGKSGCGSWRQSKGQAYGVLCPQCRLCRGSRTQSISDADTCSKGVKTTCTARLREDRHNSKRRMLPLL